SCRRRPSSTSGPICSRRWSHRPARTTHSTVDRVGKMTSKLRIRLVQLGLLAALLGIWWYATGPGGVSPLLVPSVDATLAEVWKLLGSGEMWANAAATGFEILMAVLLSVVVGFAIGFFCS